MVRGVRSADDLDAVRALFLEYRAWLVEHREVTAFDDGVFERGLQYFDVEVRALPGEYAPPAGALFLAFRGATPVGMVALRRLRPRVGEVKRLYVRPKARGAGIGRRLTGAALRRARTIGYRRVVLDTLPKMTAAVAMYRSMGFAPIPPYWAHPYPAALFFEFRFPRSQGFGSAERPSRRRCPPG